MSTGSGGDARGVEGAELPVVPRVLDGRGGAPRMEAHAAPCAATVPLTAMLSLPPAQPAVPKHERHAPHIPTVACLLCRRAPSVRLLPAAERRHRTGPAPQQRTDRHVLRKAVCFAAAVLLAGSPMLPCCLRRLKAARAGAKTCFKQQSCVRKAFLCTPPPPACLWPGGGPALHAQLTPWLQAVLRPRHRHNEKREVGGSHRPSAHYSGRVRGRRGASHAQGGVLPMPRSTARRLAQERSVSPACSAL